MNSEELIREFSKEKIRRVVWNYDNTKFLGLDGVNLGFVRDFRTDIKDDFIRMLEEFHKFGRMVKGENSSFIVLIHKKTNSTKLSDFRPISLIGCIYIRLSLRNWQIDSEE